MHIFIDTNILLKFYHFSKDDLDHLDKIFIPREDAGVEVHLTRQVYDEFIRNREMKIKDALKRFSNASINVELPYFMRVYSEYDEIIKLKNELQVKMRNVKEKSDEDIANRELIADKFIFEIFNKYEITDISQKVYEEARRRVDVGNPPGKNNSLGDAINWIILIKNIPEREDLHIISEDGDFYSRMYEEKIHPFLEMEWREKKNSDVYIYKTLEKFFDKNFDDIDFHYDKRKRELIDNLKTSESFASTHTIISGLENYSYFSLEEVKCLFEAARLNNQVFWIMGDEDVKKFYDRVAIPRRDEIRDEDIN